MKNLILVLLVATFFISCEKDENSIHPIVGSYQIDLLSYHNAGNWGVNYEHEMLWTGGLYDGYITFKENGDFVNNVPECTVPEFQTGEWYSKGDLIYINGLEYTYELTETALDLYTEQIFEPTKFGIEVYLVIPE